MEIGSEYNLEFEKLVKAKKSIYDFLKPYNPLFLSSGRSGFMIIDDLLSEGEILLPGYICDCICNSIPNHKKSYYKLDQHLNIDMDDLEKQISKDTIAVVIMNYFGHLQPKHIQQRIVELKHKYGFKIIEDTTHSIFSSLLTVGDIAICSLRKWFPIPDGGVIYTRTQELFPKRYELDVNTNIEKIYGMILKTLYLNNVLDCNDLYRTIFSYGEKEFDIQEKPLKISEISSQLLNYFDVDLIIEQRINNYKYLYKTLSREGINPVCDIDDTECPFSFPIISHSRDDFRKFLIDSNIFCAVHWPIEGTILDTNKWAIDISNKIISLPIDQRYGNREMKFLADKCSQYFML